MLVFINYVYVICIRTFLRFIKHLPNGQLFPAFLQN